MTETRELSSSMDEFQLRLRGKLEQKIVESEPARIDGEAITIVPEILDLLTSLMGEVLSMVIGRCTDRDPFITVADGLTSDDPSVVRRSELNLKRGLRKVGGQRRYYSTIKDLPYRRELPGMLIDGTREVAQEAVPEERYYLVLQESFVLI